MATHNTFRRCIYCFAPQAEPGPCPKCGYENGLCAPPVWWLSPGTVVKGRYVVGRHRNSTPTELTYLAWDLQREISVELVEFYPETLVTRDITLSEDVVCIPGNELQLEKGKQTFFEKAKLYYQCISRVSDLVMDFFARNNTCYYVREKK